MRSRVVHLLLQRSPVILTIAHTLATVMPAMKAMVGNTIERVRLSTSKGERVLYASRANSQALSASGRTISALAGANSDVAVPSRTRPMMPCKIAAMRKKL